jgi:predicted anti-sigma-YlaC factor YlaD
MLAMISCRHASELMSQQLDRKLKLSEKLRLQAHLMICKSCPKTLQQFEILREAGKRYAKHQETSQEQDLTLSADSRQRILHKLQEQQSEPSEE